jgi:glycosyltransferase involved in cell wall biosynthesis
MKIALISSEYPPFRGGGIGTYARVVADCFAKRGHEIHVITNRYQFGSTDPAHQKKDYREGFLWVHRVDGFTDDRTPRRPHQDAENPMNQLHEHYSPCLYFAEMVVPTLERVCAEHQIDVLEAPECAAEGFSVIRRRRLGLGFIELPITVALHSPIEEIYRYNLYSRHNIGFARRKYMEDYCVRHADTIWSPSRLLGEIVRERLGLADDRRIWATIPLPMDFSSIPENLSTTRHHSDSSRRSVFFVGRLEPRKGVRDLVDAAVQVMDRHPELHVELVGEDCAAGEAPGGMVEFLRSRIPDNRRHKFAFPGPLPRDQLFERYANATACVFAPRWDNFPNTCMEAMSSGACVVASDYSGMADMIEHEKSGLLFRAGSVDALASAILRAIEDEPLNARIRCEAPRRIRALCDPDVAVKSRVLHYERTIAAHREANTGKCSTSCATQVARRSSFGEARHSRRPLVSVFVTNHGPADRIHESIEAARAAAEYADADVDISVIGSGGHEGTVTYPADIHFATAERPSNNAARALWLERARHTKADYLFPLWPGDAPDVSFLDATLRVLEEESDVAWATTWLLPAFDTVGFAYAGFDFSTPLELIGYHPVPFASIRASAFDEVGGYNLDLPTGWTDWDLWLAFEEGGKRGIVIPLWLGRFLPRMEYTLTPPEASELHTVVLERILERSPKVFQRHGVGLWLYETLR